MKPFSPVHKFTTYIRIDNDIDYIDDPDDI